VPNTGSTGRLRLAPLGLPPVSHSVGRLCQVKRREHNERPEIPAEFNWSDNGHRIPGGMRRAYSPRNHTYPVSNISASASLTLAAVADAYPEFRQ
jgi:hypothetical protein